MKQTLSSVFVLLLIAISISGQSAPDAAELTKLLNEFLAGASHNDVAMHDRFWAEDLIYTRSAGRRIGKSDLMRDLRSAPAPKPGDPVTTYSAEDIRIQQYGNTAIVAFRLVGTTDNAGKTATQNFLNSGTFLKRDGKWQVVNWQSTRTARPEEEDKKQVAAIAAAFHQAMPAADAKTLARLTDETFVWTDRDGEQLNRQQLLDAITSGRFKYVKSETKNVTVNLYGDAAVVRGVSVRTLSTASADTAPSELFYTLAFINRGGTWLAVAMNSSGN